MMAIATLSAGEGSWRSAKAWRAEYPEAGMCLVFTDVLYEDADAYRFLIEGAADIFGRKLDWVPAAEDFPDYQVPLDTPIEDYCGNPEWRQFLAQIRARAAEDVPELVWLVEGRDPWEIYRDERFVGNSRADPCSKVAKRKALDRWLKENLGADETILFGIDEAEAHRFDDGQGKGIRPRNTALGRKVEAPLIRFAREQKHLSLLYTPLQMLGLKPPRLYGMGYKHNNCGGMCCKAGMAHWQNRYRVQPERFAYDAAMERKCREYLGQGTFMKRSGKPLSLDAFGEQLAAIQITQPAFDFEYEEGSSGCGCMVDE